MTPSGRSAIDALADGIVAPAGREPADATDGADAQESDCQETTHTRQYPMKARWPPCHTLPLRWRHHHLVHEGGGCVDQPRSDLTTRCPNWIYGVATSTPWGSGTSAAEVCARIAFTAMSTEHGSTSAFGATTSQSPMSSP